MEDTTLLFVHGWCINKEYWKEQSAYFCDNYKVVTLDLPGFGQSVRIEPIGILSNTLMTSMNLLKQEN